MTALKLVISKYEVSQTLYFDGRVEKILQLWRNYVGGYVVQNEHYVHNFQKVSW